MADRECGDCVPGWVRVQAGARNPGAGAGVGSVRAGDGQYCNGNRHGKRIQLAHAERHWGDGVARAGVPVDGRGDFWCVRRVHAARVLRRSDAEHIFFSGDLRADLFCWKANRGDRRGQCGGVAVGGVPERDRDSLPVDLGHVADSAACGDDFVGDAGTR